MASHSHVLVYHGPLLSHLLGVAPSTFSTVRKTKMSPKNQWLEDVYISY